MLAGKAAGIPAAKAKQRARNRLLKEDTQVTQPTIYYDL